MATNEKGYLVQLKSPEGENVYPVIPPEAIVKSDGSTYDFDSLFTSVSNGKALVASAITDKGVETAADATYQQMAENISKMSSSVSTTEIATEDISAGDIVSPVDVYKSAASYSRYGTFSLSDGYISAPITSRPSILQYIDGSSESYVIHNITYSGSQYQAIPMDDFMFMYARLYNNLCEVFLYTRNSLGEHFNLTNSITIGNVTTFPQIVNKKRYAMKGTNGIVYLNVSGTELTTENASGSLTPLGSVRGDFKSTTSNLTTSSVLIKYVNASGTVSSTTISFGTAFSSISNIAGFCNGKYASFTDVTTGRFVLIDSEHGKKILDTTVTSLGSYRKQMIPLNDQYSMHVITLRGLGVLFQVFDCKNLKFVSNSTSIYPLKSANDTNIYNVDISDSYIGEISNGVFEIKLIMDLLVGSNASGSGFSRFIFDSKNHKLLVVDPLKRVCKKYYSGIGSAAGLASSDGKINSNLTTKWDF
nr:MAG TPA: hypothetical protein [Caudoviricetes sp.]